MQTYIVRLTTEGESIERAELADDCLHAARQALAHWHRLAPDDSAVLSMRRLETEAKRQDTIDLLEPRPAPVRSLHAFQRAAPDAAAAPGEGDVFPIAGGGQLVRERGGWWSQ